MKFNKDKVFNIAIIILFVILSIIVGYHHEPWSDEAQAWLLARDCSIYHYITYMGHYESHPMLWFLVLKVFIFFKFPYKYIFLISIFFSTIGITLFEFKTKFNRLIKVLFPFSYFIFYQYSIIARGYCLLLPLLMLISILWKDRHDKILLFTFVLCLLISTEVYTFILAGFIYLYLMYEFIKNKYSNKVKHILCFIIIFLMFLFTTIYCFPASDNSFYGTSSYNCYLFSFSFFYPYFYEFDVSDGMLDFLLIIGFILSLLIMFIIYKGYKDDKKNLIQLILFVGGPILFCLIKYYSPWHLGIIFFIFIICLILHNKENNKYLNFLLIVSLIVQCIWSCCSSYYDYFNNYSSSKDVANFIKKYDYQNMKIYALAYHSVSLNAYFDKNIFDNYQESYFMWGYKNNIFFDYIFDNISDNYDIYKEKKLSKVEKFFLSDYVHKIELDYFLENNYEVVMGIDINNKITDGDNYDDFLKYYNEYVFKADTYVEINKFYHFDYIVFVRKDIDKN